MAGPLPERERRRARVDRRGLRATGRIGVQVVDEIRGFKAWKLSYNTVNSVEPVFAPSELRSELVERLRLEALDVFAAEGIKPVDIHAEGVSTIDLEDLHGGAVEGQPRQGNSTLQSYVRGAEVESDYLNGEVVLLARLNGVEAPLNEALQLLIQEAVADKRAPGALGDEELAQLLA
ncbi:ketopantoate reductase family protein [Aeromicrobium sp. UC242_57]|uniref:ketopantoate reductase family protein n=1 Tax=Aeromicrobium sp. UC242_57 TaxID=3374624 RepID=UPI0037AC0554